MRSMNEPKVLKGRSRHDWTLKVWKCETFSKGFTYLLCGLLLVGFAAGPPPAGGGQESVGGKEPQKPAPQETRRATWAAGAAHSCLPPRGAPPSPLPPH